MFSGIIETVGKVADVKKVDSNYDFIISSEVAFELIPSQSLAHNGVCLTVTKVDQRNHYVTAIGETIGKTNLGRLKAGDLINLERCISANGRFDGHIVQGHVDEVGVCKYVQSLNGSWSFEIEFNPSNRNLVVPKGSICINGVSLTVVDALNDSFSVAIIPYTYEHTNFKNIKAGDGVNLEFDIVGKYLNRIITNLKST